jgi:molybdate transport system substrate-binding protein
MKTIRSLAGLVALASLALGLAMVQAPRAAAQNAPLHVFASNAVRTVIEAVRPQCEKAAGRPLMITFATSASMKKSIEAGEPFDVAIMAADLVDALSQEGKISPRSRANVARSSVGVGVRANGPKPDVSTPEAMKQAILKAKGVAFTAGGASVPFIDKMADRLGVAAQVKAKTIAEPSTTAAADHVLDGSADLLFTMVSEILPIKGLQLAGPIPSQFDRYLIFSAGISTKPSNAKAAQAMIKFLTSPAMVPVLKEKGMEPVKK